MGELLIGIFLIIFCIIIFLQAGDLPSFNETVLNAGSFPKFIAVILSILCLILIVSKAIELFRQRTKTTKLNYKKYFKEVFKEYKLVFFALISLFLYIFLMQFIGFIVTTILFIISTGFIIGPKKKKNVLIISGVAVVITFSTYLFFQNVLHVRFPTGLFF